MPSPLRTQESANAGHQRQNKRANTAPHQGGAHPVQQTDEGDCPDYNPGPTVLAS